MNNISEKRLVPIDAPPSKWVVLVTLWYAIGIILALTVFPANTEGFAFGGLPVTFMILSGWGFVAAVVAIDLSTRIEKRTNYRNEALAAIIVALLASGIIGINSLHATAVTEAERTQAYMRGYTLMINALDEAEKSPGDIANIKKRFGVSIMKEMMLEGGVKKEWLEQSEMFKDGQ